MNYTVEKWLTIAALTGWIGSMGSLIGLALQSTPLATLRPAQQSEHQLESALSAASLKNDAHVQIPQQLSHDVNIVYALGNGKYNIGLECKNLLDARLYDNFSLQKPSRGFYAKLRYYLSN